jgi:hypothetical protein
MADQHFAVVFSGRLVAGAERDQVRSKLAKLFNVEPPKIDRMFSGKPVLVKKNLDEAKAKDYITAFAKAGAIAEVVSNDPKAAQPSPTTPATSSSSTPAAPAEPPPPPIAPDLTIADVGVTLVEYQSMPNVDFDTTQFDLAEVGATLVEPKPIPPANFDTSDMELDPPGVLLTEPKSVEPANFNTDALSLVEGQ